MTTAIPSDQQLSQIDSELVMATAVLHESRRACLRSPNQERVADLKEAQAAIDQLLERRHTLQTDHERHT